MDKAISLIIAKLSFAIIRNLPVAPSGESGLSNSPGKAKNVNALTRFVLKNWLSVGQYLSVYPSLRFIKYFVIFSVLTVWINMGRTPVYRA